MVFVKIREELMAVLSDDARFACLWVLTMRVLTLVLLILCHEKHHSFAVTFTKNVVHD